MSEMEKYRVAVVFGGDREASIEREFETIAEVNAYHDGLHDGEGWLDYEIVYDGEYGWKRNEDGTWTHMIDDTFSSNTTYKQEKA